MKRKKIILSAVLLTMLGGLASGATAFNSGSKIKTGSTNVKHMATPTGEWNSNLLDELKKPNGDSVTFSDFKPFGSPVYLCDVLIDIYSGTYRDELLSLDLIERQNYMIDLGLAYYGGAFMFHSGMKSSFLPKVTSKEGLVVYRMLDIIDSSLFERIESEVIDPLALALVRQNKYQYGGMEMVSFATDSDGKFQSTTSTTNLYELSKDGERLIRSDTIEDYVMGNQSYSTKIWKVPTSFETDTWNPFLIGFDGEVNMIMQLEANLALSYFLYAKDIKLLANTKIQPYVVHGFTYDDMLFDGYEKDIYINIDNNLTQDEVLAQVSAVDVFGKEVDVVVESSTYVTGKIGDYSIVLKATDDYGVVAHATLKIHVLDLTKPVIRQTSAIRIPYGGSISEAQVLNYFTITDNVGIKSRTFTLPSNFKFDSALSYGNYSLTLTATDTSDNATSLQFTIEVYDDVAPVISKKTGNTSDPIIIGYSKTLHYDMNTIINLFKAEDEIDGTCQVYLKSGKLSMNLGSQTLVLGAKDSKGNEGVLSITITIQQDVPPVFILSDKVVATSPSSPLDLSDLTQIVQNYMLRNVQATNLSITANDYMANTDTEGTYTIGYSYIDENNISVASSFDLVVSRDIPADGEVVEKKDNWFDIIRRNIGLFFRECGHFIERCVNIVRGKGWKTDEQVKADKALKDSIPTETSSTSPKEDVESSNS